MISRSSRIVHAADEHVVRLEELGKTGELRQTGIEIPAHSHYDDGVPMRERRRVVQVREECRTLCGIVAQREDLFELVDDDEQLVPLELVVNRQRGRPVQRPVIGQEPIDRRAASSRRAAV